MHSFLLVKLNFEFLSGARDEDDLHGFLDTIAELDYDDEVDESFTAQYLERVIGEAYCRNIDRIIESAKTSSDWQNASDAKLTLGFIRDAVRPLSVAELEILLKRNPRQRIARNQSVPSIWEAVRRCCQGLVEKDESDQVHYLHQSLNKYLKTFNGMKQISNQQAELGKKCVDYLNKDFCAQGICPNEVSLEQRLREWPLLDYAARYWQQHLINHEEFMKTGGEEVLNEYNTLHNLALQFLRDNSHVESAFQVTLFSDKIFQATIKSSLQNIKLPWKVQLVFDSNPGHAEKILAPFSPNQTTGLHLTSKFGLLSLLQKLLPVPSQTINCANSQGLTPLHFAVLGGHVSSVQTLINNGADPGLRNELGGITPLMLATKQPEIIQLLMRRPDLIDVNAQTQTSDLGNRRIVFDFVYREGVLGINRTARSVGIVNGRTALELAARNGNLAALKALLSDPKIDANVQDAEGQTALHRASKKGYLDCVETLLDFGVDPFQKIGCLPDGTPSSAECTKDEDYRGTALHLACTYERSNAVVKHLLKSYPELREEANTLGMRPLHLATQLGGVRNMITVLEAGVDVNARTVEGCTSLHFAMQTESKEAVRLLLRHEGIRINIPDNNGRTPLHFGSIFGFAQNLAVLLEEPTIKINTVDDWCRPALFYAAVSGGFEAFRLLWERDHIDRNIRDVKGKKLSEYVESWTTHANGSSYPVTPDSLVHSQVLELLRRESEKHENTEPPSP